MMRLISIIKLSIVFVILILIFGCQKIFRFPLDYKVGKKIPNSNVLPLTKVQSSVFTCRPVYASLEMLNKAVATIALTTVLKFVFIFFSSTYNSFEKHLVCLQTFSLLLTPKGVHMFCF